MVLVEKVIGFVLHLVLARLGQYPFDAKVAAERPDVLARGLVLFGAKDIEDLKVKQARYTLKGCVERITCPILALHGEAEMAFLHPAGTLFQPNDWYSEHSKRIFDEIPHEDKKLIVYPTGTPGALHCQHDADAVAREQICDWLETTFTPA